MAIGWNWKPRARKKPIDDAVRADDVDRLVRRVVCREVLGVRLEHFEERKRARLVEVVHVRDDVVEDDPEIRSAPERQAVEGREGVVEHVAVPRGRSGRDPAGAGRHRERPAGDGCLLGGEVGERPGEPACGRGSDHPVGGQARPTLERRDRVARLRGEAPVREAGVESGRGKRVLERPDRLALVAHPHVRPLDCEHGGGPRRGRWSRRLRSVFGSPLRRRGAVADDCNGPGDRHKHQHRHEGIEPRPAPAGRSRASDTAGPGRLRARADAGCRPLGRGGRSGRSPTLAAGERSPGERLIPEEILGGTCVHLRRTVNHVAAGSKPLSRLD